MPTTSRGLVFELGSIGETQHFLSKSGSQNDAEGSCSECDVIGSKIPEVSQQCRLGSKVIVLGTLVLFALYCCVTLGLSAWSQLGATLREAGLSGSDRNPSTAAAADGALYRNTMRFISSTRNLSDPEAMRLVALMKHHKKYNRSGVGMGCINWEQIQLWIQKVHDLASCEAECDERSACKGFAFVARLNCEGQPAHVCALWSGACESAPAPCWDNYEVVNESNVETKPQTHMTTQISTTTHTFTRTHNSTTVRQPATTSTSRARTTALTHKGSDGPRDRPVDKALPDKDGIVLLTSAFLPQKENRHVDEIYAALNANILNEHITEVHVLTESDCDELEDVLVQWAKRAPDEAKTLRQMGEKLTCTSTQDKAQPTYGDFFRYANESLSHRIVLFSNGDVVFDDTLGLFDTGPVKRRERGYILSVQPPPRNGVYKKVFHHECDATPRCTVGKWAGGGSWGQQSAGCSWDVYIFSPPLPSKMDLGHLDNVIMNFNGAENLAGFQLEVGANISLSNPCYHVHAFHWHCQGTKMHSLDAMVRVDHPEWYVEKLGLPAHTTADAVSDVLPCWNCPGIRMPKGAVSTQDYCQKGTMLNSEQVDALKLNFRNEFVSSGICCSDPNTCSKLPVQWLPHCVKAEDLDCVTWDAVHPHTYY